jgi:hypothetical protein
MISRRVAVFAFGACTWVLASSPVLAQWHDRDHDIRRFHEHDFDRWRGGHWVHGAYGGRDGWWWVIGPTWYYYPAPVYPYPDPYVPPVVAAPPPPVAAVPPPAAPPPGMAVPAPPPPAQYYFCDRPSGYYPYVRACRAPWRVVLAAPP